MKRIRAATHVHSNWSYDGSYSLESLSRMFAERGLDAVLMTEHDRGFDQARWAQYRDACRNAREGGAFLLPGMEYSDPDNRTHILVWGRDLPFFGEGLPTKDLLDRLADHEYCAVMAHPNSKNAWIQVSPSWIDRLSGVELWNRKSDGWAPTRAARQLLELGGLKPFVGIDFHTRRQLFPLHMELEIDGEMNEISLYRALCEGRCQPRAFGRSAERFAGGWRFAAMRMSENARLALAIPLRKWRRRRAAREQAAIRRSESPPPESR